MMSVRRKGRRWYSVARARRTSFFTAREEWVWVVLGASASDSSSPSSGSEGGVTRRRCGGGSGEESCGAGDCEGSGSCEILALVYACKVGDVQRVAFDLASREA